MNTKNYPELIEEQSIALTRITERRDQAHNHLEAITDEITREVLAETDPETGKPRHTNDKAREIAIRERQRASGEYQTWATIEREAKTDHAEASARLERLRGQFSLSKIERRERIAAIEAAIG